MRWADTSTRHRHLSKKRPRCINCTMDKVLSVSVNTAWRARKPLTLETRQVQDITTK